MDTSIQLVGFAVVGMGFVTGSMTRKRTVPIQFALIGVLTFVAGTFLP